MKKEDLLTAVKGLTGINESNSFISKLGRVINEFEDDPEPDPEKYLEEKFDQLLESLNSIRIEAIPYSEVTRIVFDFPEESDTLNMLLPALLSAINNKVENLDTDIIPDSYLIIVKVYEHLELANKQLASLYKKQRTEIKKANENVTRLTADTQIALEKVNEVDKKISKFTVDFITILGIFTSITFATFGGLQLLGNVFGKVKSLTNENVGFEIMLGSVFLFGICLILIILFNGLSRFTSQSYTFEKHTQLSIVFSLFILFLLGFFLSHPTFLNIILENI